MLPQDMRRLLETEVLDLRTKLSEPSTPSHAKYMNLSRKVSEDEFCSRRLAVSILHPPSPAVHMPSGLEHGDRLGGTVQCYSYSLPLGANVAIKRINLVCSGAAIVTHSFVTQSTRYDRQVCR